MTDYERHSLTLLAAIASGINLMVTDSMRTNRKAVEEWQTHLNGMLEEVIKALSRERQPPARQ